MSSARFDYRASDTSEVPNLSLPSKVLVENVLHSSLSTSGFCIFWT